MNPKVADAVIARAAGSCELERCPFPAEQIHHAMPRSRGGRVLDDHAADAVKAGTFDPDRHCAHLLHLCHRCHALAHGNPAWARAIGATIPGSVITEQGRPTYVGGHGRMIDLWGKDVA